MDSGGILDLEQIDSLTSAINRLADAMERHCESGLGGVDGSLYKAAPQNEAELVDEATMAEKLNIPVRTLGNHRRAGKFPNCWIRNGKHIRWHVSQALELWQRGIS